MTPIPTPFDIVLPPAPAWSPSSAVWLLFGVVLLGIICLILVRSKKPPPLQLNFRDQLLRDVRRCLSDRDTRELHYVVQLAMRTLTVVSGNDYAALSSSALRQVSQNTGHPSIASFIFAIAAAKDLLYAPSQREEQKVIAAKQLLISAEELLSVPETSSSKEDLTNNSPQEGQELKQ